MMGTRWLTTSLYPCVVSAPAKWKGSADQQNGSRTWNRLAVRGSVVRTLLNPLAYEKLHTIYPDGDDSGRRRFAFQLRSS